MPPRFSVVIPVHNRAGLIGTTLQSVFAQRCADFEVIAIDDGSTDDTPEVLAASGGRLQWHRQERSGPGPARNAGAACASGDYLAFLDSDDLWFPWTLEVYARAIERTGQPSFLAGKPILFGRADDLAAATEADVSCRSFADYFASGDRWRWWGASSFVVRADAFRAAGGFLSEAVNGEDADLAMRLGASPGFVQVLQPHTFGYRQHAGSAMSDTARTARGAWHAIEAERHGRYPGGRARRRERQRILGRHLRPVMMGLLHEGRRREAWRMYQATASWHLRLGRLRFLAMFPFLTMYAAVRARL